MAALAELFKEARTRYDSGATWTLHRWDWSASSKIIMGHVDVTLYVVRQGHTRRQMLRGVNELFRDGKVAHLNVISQRREGGPRVRRRLRVLHEVGPA